MLSSEMPVLNMDLDGDGEQTVAPHEEFGVLEASEDEHLVEMRDKKVSRVSTALFFVCEPLFICILW